MNGIDIETLCMLKELLEKTSDPVKQFLRGYAKGALDAMQLQKPA